MHGTAPRSTVKDPDPAETVLVWDLPLRLWHWLLAVLVLVAWVTPNVHDELHRLAGYAILGLRATPAYVWNLRRGRTGRYLGLNPAGTAMQLALLLLLIVSAGSGAMQVTVRFFGIWWVEDTHEVTSYILIPLVVLHVAGVVLVSRLQRENLARAMLTGRKLLRRSIRGAPVSSPKAGS
jgi:cytochrome b